MTNENNRSKAQNRALAIQADDLAKQLQDLPPDDRGDFLTMVGCALRDRSQHYTGALFQRIGFEYNHGGR